jgi:hypothetical protein
MNKGAAAIILHFNRKPAKWFLKCAATKMLPPRQLLGSLLM